MAVEIGDPNRGGRWERCYAPFLECDESRNVKNLNNFIEFSNYFFLARSAELN